MIVVLWKERATIKKEEIGMQLEVMFDKILKKAGEDPAFKDRLLDSSKSDHALVSFCKECNAVDIPLYPMDLADADESVYAAMRRSTNGGGENSPHLNWEEEIFGALVDELKKL